jgi:hypothetical protein
VGSSNYMCQMNISRESFGPLAEVSLFSSHGEQALYGSAGIVRCWPIVVDRHKFVAAKDGRVLGYGGRFIRSAPPLAGRFDTLLGTRNIFDSRTCVVGIKRHLHFRLFARMCVNGPEESAC